MDLYTIAFIVIVILAVAMPIVFFKGHNENVRRMKIISKRLEDYLKPADKEYVLLGTSVGFRALFIVNRDNINKVETVLILLPRQSLIYYPISRLTTKHDKFIVKVEFTKDLGLGRFAFTKSVKRCSSYVKTINYNRRKYYLCGNPKWDVIKVLSNIRNWKYLYEVSYEKRTLFIEFLTSKDTVVDDTMDIINNVKSLFSIK